MSVKLLTEYHLEFLRLTGGCTGSSESTHVKMPHCWKSHVTPHLSLSRLKILKTCLLVWSVKAQIMSIIVLQNYTVTDAVQKATEEFQCKPIEGMYD